METWKAQQNKACKAQGVWFPCFMVLARSFSILPANKQQSMSGAKALLRYTAVSDKGEMQQIAIIREGSLKGSGKNITKWQIQIQIHRTTTTKPLLRCMLVAHDIDKQEFFPFSKALSAQNTS